MLGDKLMIPTKMLYETIDEMIQVGITKSSKQSEYLKKEHDFTIFPHELAEYKWLKWNGDKSAECVIKTELAWENREQKSEIGKG
jgi:hypothetical protein